MNSTTLNTFLVQFNERYTDIHGKILFPLIIFGILINLITILILRKEDFRTPINFILQRMALFRTIALISYSIYSFYFYILYRPQPFVGQSIFWPCFLILHFNLELTAHSITFWLTCLLAIIQMIIVSKPNETIIDFIHVSRLIQLISIMTCLLMIPNYLTWNIVLQRASVYHKDLYDENSNETVFWISTNADVGFKKNAFVILALGFKILPILILIIFSILLKLNLYRIRQTSERHLPRITITSSSSSSSTTTIIISQLPTTEMVLIINFLTILIEFPQVLLFIISEFNIYLHLAHVWDLTSIGLSFITFVVYSFMSRQFRSEISKLVFQRYLQETNRRIDREIDLEVMTTIEHRLFISKNTLHL